MRKSKIRRVLPSRRYAHGTLPGITVAGPLGPNCNGEEQWIFPNVALTSPEKKMILGKIMLLAVEILFKTHCYSLKRFVFKQSDGGPIGLRPTCAIAKVVMARHNQKWSQSMLENNISTEFNGFYVDDGCIFMFSIRPGWRWCNGGLWFCKDWEKVDSSSNQLRGPRMQW